MGQVPLKFSYRINTNFADVDKEISCQENLGFLYRILLFMLFKEVIADLHFSLKTMAIQRIFIMLEEGAKRYGCFIHAYVL